MEQSCILNVVVAIQVLKSIGLYQKKIIFNACMLRKCGAMNSFPSNE